MKKSTFTLLLSVILTSTVLSQSITAQWDSIKTTINPSVAPAFSEEFETPYRQPLAAYGWEDGLHISRDGLHLYALYYPGDLLAWSLFFGANVGTSTFCELFGDSSFIRPYANNYGMDMYTNTFGCDYFLNVDIVYANRSSVLDSFTTWQLSDIARPGAGEGSPFPLFSESDPMQTDIFLFTGNSDIWMLRNTPANPSNIASASRLLFPINPNTNEFEADNPHLERLNGDTLLLVYEKYTNSEEREFMYSLSYDNGYNWTVPIVINTIHHTMGKIEHPHLYKDNMGDWYLYFSLSCDIYRAKQGVANDWDSWQTPELIISKGNSLCVGEPTLTDNGDISFVVVYSNHVNNDSTDTYDIDPWYLPSKQTLTSSSINTVPNKFKLYPNPFDNDITISTEKEIKRIVLLDVQGRTIWEGTPTNKNSTLNFGHLHSGIYLVQIHYENSMTTTRIYKR